MVVVIYQIGGNAFRGCCGCVDGGVVGFRDGFWVETVEDHDGRLLAELFRSRYCDGVLGSGWVIKGS